VARNEAGSCAHALQAQFSLQDEQDLGGCVQNLEALGILIAHDSVSLRQVPWDLNHERVGLRLSDAADPLHLGGVHVVPRRAAMDGQLDVEDG